MARKKNDKIIIGTKAIDPKSKLFENIRSVYKALKSKYPEFKHVDLPEKNTTKADIWISPPGYLNANPSSIVILVLEDGYTPLALEKLITHNVLGVVFGEKIERPEYEELGKLENLMKEAIRIVLHRTMDERELYKPVDWKFPYSNNSSREMESTYMSLFFDPSAKRLLKDLRVAVAKIIESAEMVKKSKKELFQEYRKASRNQENSKNTGVKEIFKELGKKFKGIRFPSVLITGPSGAGKTLIARFIAERFVEALYGENEDAESYFFHLPLVNMDKSTMDAELFGVLEGSYTGARNSCGALAKNVGGIVFLDEIGDAPLNVQTKLLAYLDDHKIIPVNYGEEPPYAPTLIVAATNKNIESMVSSGEFRADLYHRFDFKLKVPGLEERRQDMRFLISHILTRGHVNPGMEVENITLRAIERLESLHFTGNFRELEDILRTAVELAKASGRKIILERDIMDSVFQ